MRVCKLYIMISFYSYYAFGQIALGYLPLYTEQNSFTSDIVLLYQQGYKSEELNKSNLLPYVIYENRKGERKEWLYDGFLFITAIDNEGNQYTNVGKNKSAKRSEWERVIAWNFTKDQAIDGLDKLIDEIGSDIGYPIRKRKIFLSIPEPIKHENDWGAVDGKKLDFNSDEDRFVACNWFISKTIEEWKKLSPKNLEFAGYYWITEYVKESEKIIRRMKSTLTEMNLKLIWIPYWGASGALQWKEVGFDATYIQPNYFFSSNIDFNRFEEACNFAYEHGMGLEFEFDKKLFDNKSVFIPRFNA